MVDELTPPYVPPRRPPRLAALVLVALLGFGAGAGGVGWLAWHEGLTLADLTGLPITRPRPTPVADDPRLLTTAGVLDTRLSGLEQRMARIDTQAALAAGNAARAEALLVAFAARRAIDRGVPLGYLEEQIRLRFGDALPLAVNTVIASGKPPLTLDQLYAQLDQNAAKIAGSARTESGWERVKREFSGLFTIRKGDANGGDAQAQLNQARLALRMGRVEEAAAIVQRLPGAADAQGWLAAAHHYAEVQHALDLMETTALLEPRELKDSMGRKVEQPSPFSPQADASAGAGDAADGAESAAN